MSEHTIRHRWDGDSFEKTCRKCGLIRRNFTGEGGYAYCGEQTANNWQFTVRQVPACAPRPVPARAEIEAGRIARRLEKAGFEVKFTVDRTPAELHDNRVIHPERVHASVMAHPQRSFESSYGFGFISYLPAPGHRARTIFLGAREYRSYKPKRARSSVKKLTLRRLHFAVAGEVENAYFRAQRVAERVSQEA